MRGKCAVMCAPAHALSLVCLLVHFDYVQQYKRRERDGGGVGVPGWCSKDAKREIYIVFRPARNAKHDGQQEAHS